MFSILKDVNACLFLQLCINNGNKILYIYKFCMPFILLHLIFPSNSIGHWRRMSASCNRFAEVSISKNVIASPFVWER